MLVCKSNPSHSNFSRVSAYLVTEDLTPDGDCVEYEVDFGAGDLYVVSRRCAICGAEALEVIPDLATLRVIDSCYTENGSDLVSCELEDTMLSPVRAHLASDIMYWAKDLYEWDGQPLWRVARRDDIEAELGLEHPLFPDELAHDPGTAVVGATYRKEQSLGQQFFLVRLDDMTAPSVDLLEAMFRMKWAIKVYDMGWWSDQTALPKRAGKTARGLGGDRASALEDALEQLVAKHDVRLLPDDEKVIFEKEELLRPDWAQDTSSYHVEIVASRLKQ